MQNASNWAQTCKTVYMSLGLHVKTVASIKPFFVYYPVCTLNPTSYIYIYIVTIPKAITYDVTYKNTDKLFTRFHILTRVAWYWSSPHTLWALWCYNAHGICSHMFGNGNHSEGTSGKYRRTLVSDMFCEPETDRDKYSFVSLTVTLSWELRILLSAFGYSQNYALSRGRDLKPPPAALPQLVKWNRYSNPSVIFYWGRENKGNEISKKAATLSSDSHYPCFENRQQSWAHLPCPEFSLKTAQHWGCRPRTLSALIRQW